MDHAMSEKKGMLASKWAGTLGANNKIVRTVG
jgi:hypothetical protein